jgi:hypothetical protein
MGDVTTQGWPSGQAARGGAMMILEWLVFVAVVFALCWLFSYACRRD